MDLGLQLWPALDEWAEDRCEQAGAEIRRGGDAQDPSGFARELGEPRDDAPDPVQQVRWPAPGAPELIPRVRELLAAQRIGLNVDAQRGFDHGTFVPGAVMWPEPTVPVLQMSLVRGLDPERHLAIGRALAPLRDEGVLILASGMSYHDMRGFFSVMRGQGREAVAVADRFAEWLVASVRDGAREEHLAHWDAAPAGRAAHPREEHLLPLMVAAGAGLDDPASVVFDDDVLGVRVNAVRFG